MKSMTHSCALARLLAILLGIASIPAMAWSNHALGTWQALEQMLGRDTTTTLQVESLEAFLLAQGPLLENVLQQEEKWAQVQVPEYPPRPAALAYSAAAGADSAQNRRRFLAALRINPQAKLPLYLQLRPGANPAGKPILPWQAVTNLQHSASVMNGQFLRLQEGDQVAVLDVLASASDEPDYGLDLGLWSNNPGGQNLAYGFGAQPFGNPALEYSSQAPFHMGFFHESPIIYSAAHFLRRTYPEYRIHLYQTLARHAMASGHAYWGWRFAGWALHYVQDLTQPYHAKVLPGVGVVRMLWINALDLMGAHASKREIITLVSNRHSALENYQYRRMRAAYLSANTEDVVLHATRESAARALSYTPSSVRLSISKQAHAMADATDTTLEQLLPEKTISDPDYVFGESEPEIDLFALLAKASPEKQERMSQLVAGLMRNFGTHTRSFIQSLQPALPPKK